MIYGPSVPPIVSLKGKGAKILLEDIGFLHRLVLGTRPIGKI